MAAVVLFHHAQGLTPGVLAVAESWRAAGHTVHAPDTYAGHTFDTLEAGLGYAREVGFGALQQAGVDAVADLPAELVYVGFSLGVMPAQLLAQTRPGARGAVLMGSCVPPEEFGGPWPDGLPAQVHGMDRDPIFADEGDLDAARALVAAAPSVELFVYPGDAHLFVDSSLTDFRPEAAALFGERVLAFLAALG